jgi:hypothetical protein
MSMAQGAGVNSAPFANSVGTYGQVWNIWLLFCMIYLHCKFYDVIKINYGGPDTGHVRPAGARGPVLARGP